ncbi:zona pellucida-binding protein 1 isoform X3 [Hemicordylus capensis]|uniref:zona pellucida-binding protein 1 isoform X3 n=1 Tax=Hemicordylus capensis TaxID=884348 RepID=UPI0023041ED0|nr:zona pellucida-binding protein 1 isoform X3 [Hemicordylus capensis]
MRRRGQRRRPGPSSACFGFCAPLLALALSLLRAFPSVHSHKVDPSGLKVVGSTNLPVKVYVKLNHNSPRILCVTNRLRNSELIDPIFQWHGPEGDLVTENRTVKITPTGTLLFRHFKIDMSGVYTCSLVFKPTIEQAEKNYLIKYVVYGKISYLLRSTPLKKNFMKLHVLKTVLLYYFSSLDTEKTKGPCEKGACDIARRLRKAKDLIEKFFNQQVEVLGKRTSPLPEIYYIEGTLQMVWVNRCYPGYGMNALLHPDCPNCCVVCSPGSFNPHEGVHCLQCNKSLEYGATHC